MYFFFLLPRLQIDSVLIWVTWATWIQPQSSTSMACSSSSSYLWKIQADMNTEPPPDLPAPLMASYCADKSMKIWVKYGGQARRCPLAVKPCSVSSTHIAITVTGLLLQLCLCQFQGRGAPAGMTEGEENVMGKPCWPTVVAAIWKLLRDLKSSKDLVRGALTTAAHKPVSSRSASFHWSTEMKESS